MAQNLNIYILLIGYETSMFLSKDTNWRKMKWYFIIYDQLKIMNIMNNKQNRRFKCADKIYNSIDIYNVIL